MPLDGFAPCMNSVILGGRKVQIQSVKLERGRKSINILTFSPLDNWIKA